MSEACTISESHFLNYCQSRAYAVERIATTKDAGRFPDYKITTPAGPLIVEIKEFSPNKEDRLFAERLEKHGQAGFSRSIGKRVQKAIMDARSQLRRYKDTPLPELLLLYDGTGGMGGMGGYLEPLDLAAGMFGEPVIRFWLDSSRKPVDATDAGHGGGRQLTQTTGLHIGALGVIKAKNNSVCVDFYHNPFSAKPVWPRYFLHPDDRHYIRPDHPDKSGWEWSEFVGDRKSA